MQSPSEVMILLKHWIYSQVLLFQNDIDRLEDVQRKVTDVFKALEGLIYGRKLPEIKMNIMLKL